MARRRVRLRLLEAAARGKCAGPGVVANHKRATTTDGEEVVWVAMQLGPMQVRVGGKWVSQGLDVVRLMRAFCKAKAKTTAGPQPRTPASDITIGHTAELKISR